MSKELERDLVVLVELDLYKRIRAIRDGKFLDEDKIITEAINSFENGLPEHLKQISNCHGIIVNALKQVEQNMKEIEQIRQGAKREEEQER